MANDVVILLSSDDFDDNVFVTPHPRTAADHRRQTADFTDDLTDCISPARPHRQHVGIVQIDDTPAPVSQASRQHLLPPAARPGMTLLEGSIREKAARAAVERLQSSRGGDHSVHDDEERPAKRQRQSPGVAPMAAPRAATGASYVDLLSSSDSDSEANLTRSTTEPPAADSDFVDIDDLLTQPSPRKQRQQPSPQPSRRQKPQQQQPLDILLLSSSPMPSPVRRTSCAPPARPTQPLQRSFSEGHAFAFSDDDDNEDAIAAEALLADWRKNQAASKPASDRGTTATKAPRPRKKQQPVDEEKREEKRKEKQAERERRLKEKEIDKERRKIAAELAKELRAKERAEAAAFNDANKSRVDKAVAAPEMIVRLPRTLPEATREVVEAMLAEIKASHEEWTSTPVDNVVTWRRKVSNEYKSELGHWVPVPTRIEDEAHALVVLRAEEFVQLILAGHNRDNPDIRHAAGGHDLGSHVAAMKRTFAGYTIVYLVEGLHAWRSKNRTIRNRQFVAAVRGDGGDAAASTTTAPTRPSQRLGRRGQKQPPQHLDEALVDEALLDLQIDYNDDDMTLLVHETVSSLDTARWLRVFTEQIATGRYRQQREALYAAAASFCMDSGQIATGDDPQDLYALILQQVARVTEPVALGVAARFETIPQLVQGFQEQGPLALEAVLKSRNRNGALSDRTIGPALSRRLHKVFLGRDAASTDV
ncbi:hypothetical protein SEUCBS139899_005773 [Sporothrix eucalyptigena]|uniref:ERCC4 domain-containing protein n=1 Tax=Sporothrix eucalyptigena TaxID=1812306 RepID=A0ABP0BNH4_9PEZI